MILYHGSNVIVQEPQILENGFYKDFGYGFYCTILEKQAKRWALTKRRKHIVNFYEYSQYAKLRVKKFDEMTEEWLQFVVNCRLGLKHDYDIVEGPMADDTIWDFVNGFISGKISRSVFWEYARFKHPTHQISFHTVNALRCLTFERSEHIHDGKAER